jgi:hypothetical protein
MIPRHSHAEHPTASESAPAAPPFPAPAAPPGTVRALPQHLSAGLDRRLGYFGEARFVMFYYEPRGEEVLWNDGRSYGFASGAWCMFTERIIPLAVRHGFNLGPGAAGGTSGGGQAAAAATDALVVDRLTGRAYFARRDAALRFPTPVQPGQRYERGGGGSRHH